MSTPKSESHLPPWKDAPITGCVIQPLKKYRDSRGWLAEIFRSDELESDVHPVMSYISMTHPGVARGPHEHVEQTDMFVFFSGRFRVFLWDSREHSDTFGCRQILEFGEDDPAVVLVPPGVVHAYRNVGDGPGLIVNCPNQLYAGEGKKEEVDEIRHEDRDDSVYEMI
jgi:dTDP-4-dehydrorhamnose 3,5-epimerase